MTAAELIRDILPDLGVGLVMVAALLAAGHAILFKRNSKSAFGWLGLIIVLPLVGPLVYVLLGINRIQRRAARLRVRLPPSSTSAHPLRVTPDALGDRLPHARHLVPLARFVENVTRRPLLNANRVWPLQNGDAAYPAMIEAIDQARESVSLASYIFAHDVAGQMFTEALARAVRRGVEVRVLIDEVGSRYSFPPAAHMLHHADVPAALFMRTYAPWRTPYMNLRSHRKILVADGRVGFTGGINIRRDNLLDHEHPDPAVQDMHFRVTGPVVGHLQEVFAEDWAFTTGEMLQGTRWFPALAGEGPVLARGIADGPDEDHDRTRQVIFGALACAQRSVRVASPYFLPDSSLITALNVAAMRGVEVEILIPRKGNLRMVDWAMMAQLWQVLERGCSVWMLPPPFDHTKVMLVDGIWSLIGSANWDARSLRLNFEFNMECYDGELAGELGALLDAKKRTAHRLALTEADSRSIPIRLRDGIARLFSPYL
jgi:cardiolipin synthase A/B